MRRSLAADHIGSSPLQRSPLRSVLLLDPRIERMVSMRCETPIWVGSNLRRQPRSCTQRGTMAIVSGLWGFVLDNLSTPAMVTSQK